MNEKKRNIKTNKNHYFIVLLNYNFSFAGFFNYSFQLSSSFYSNIFLLVGKILFNKTHSDYHSMHVLNTVFGGYFGSRLMTNIREDKGYTYGIGSGITSLQHSGYFFISTEVGVDVTKQAIKVEKFSLLP